MTLGVSRHREGVGGDDGVEQGGVGVEEGVEGVGVEEGGGAQALVQLEGEVGAE